MSLALFYNFSVLAPRNCHVESVLLLDAPQAFYQADGLHHVISRKRHFPMINDTNSHGTRVSTLDCHASVICPGSLSKLTLNHRDLVLNLEMDNCETRPKAFVARLQPTPSVQRVFESLPPLSAEFNMCSQSVVRKSVLTSVRIELAELPELHTMDFDEIKEVAEPISQYYASIPPAASKALEGKMQTKSALCLALIHDHIFDFFQRRFHFVHTSVVAILQSFATLFSRYIRAIFTHR